MQASPMVSLSPSFTLYSNTNLTEIAARVVEECRTETETESEFFFDYNEPEDDKDENDKNQANKDDDFEFAFVTTGSDQFSHISADEIFSNGQIRPIFPIFGLNELGSGSDSTIKKWNLSLTQEERIIITRPTTLKPTDMGLQQVSTPPKSIRVSLGKLFIEDRELTSSETDDLEGIPQGAYCVWTPSSPTERCKKSNSTGSSSSASKRWKLRDFLHRSNSEGKQSFVYLMTPLKKREEKAEKTRTDSAKITGKVTGGDKRRSYLPYRQDLIGFFGNVNELNRNLPPFKG